MKWLRCVDGVYIICVEGSLDSTRASFDMSTPGVETHIDAIFVCRWQTDDEDDRIEFTHAWRQSAPVELDQWSRSWPVSFRGRVDASGPLELFTLELEPMGVLTPRWAGGPVEYQLFMRLARRVDVGEPREQHMLVLWPSNPPIVWFEREE